MPRGPDLLQHAPVLLPVSLSVICVNIILRCLLFLAQVLRLLCWDSILLHHQWSQLQTYQSACGLYRAEVIGPVPSLDLQIYPQRHDILQAR